MSSTLIVTHLTRGEQIWLDWALGALDDFWKEQEIDGEPGPLDLERESYNDLRKGENFIVPIHRGFVQDLLYRLEDQAPAMADNLWKRLSAACADRLATKIRETLIKKGHSSLLL